MLLNLSAHVASLCADDFCLTDLWTWSKLSMFFHNLLDNLISPPSVFHTLILSLSFCCWSASLSHLLSTLRPSRTKARNSCSVCEGRKVTLGDDRGTKMCESEWSNMEGRLGVGRKKKEKKRDGSQRSWHRDNGWLIKGQHCITAEHWFLKNDKYQVHNNKLLECFIPHFAKKRNKTMIFMKIAD